MKSNYSYIELACMTTEQRIALQNKRTEPMPKVNRNDRDAWVYNANAYYWLQATGITHHILSAHHILAACS